MALDTNARAKAYPGNGSTSLPYFILFPYLEPAHVRVQVSPGGGSPVLLDPAAYVVHEPGGGATPYVTTAAAYGGDDEVVIFRWVPYTQPVVLPEGGQLPAATLESALDRLTMLAMQTSDTSLDGNDPGITIPAEGLRDVLSWTDEGGRAGVPARRTGQLGVQLADRTVWVSQGTDAGDWTPAGAVTPRRWRIAFAGDTGQSGGAQTALRAAMAAVSPDLIVLGGDNVYQPETAAAALAAFAPDFAAGKVRLVYGNHDSDVPAQMAAQMAMVAAHVPGAYGGRYYSQVLAGGLVELFVLHSGKNTAGQVIEPDGIAAGQAQYNNIRAAVRRSTARWRIAAMHIPHVTTVAGNIQCPEMEWAAKEGWFDLILCGHNHANEEFLCHGTPMLNASAAVRSAEPVHGIPQGAAGGAVLRYADDMQRAFAVLDITERSLSWTLHETAHGEPLYGNSTGGCTLPVTADDYEVFAPGTPVPEGASQSWITRVVQSRRVHQISLSCGEGSSGTLSFILHRNGADVLSGTFSPSFRRWAVPWPQVFAKGDLLELYVECGYGSVFNGLRVGITGNPV